MKKRLLIFSMLLLIFSACEVVIVEEPVIVVADPRDFFIGSYGVDEYSETFNVHSDYSIRIFKSADYAESIIIENFYGVGLDVLADVDVNGIDIYIPSQDVAGYHIRGGGFIEGGRLSLSYTVRDHFSNNPITDRCSTVAWR